LELITFDDLAIGTGILYAESKDMALPGTTQHQSALSAEIGEIQTQQERRLAAVVQALEDAKQVLEEAMAAVQARDADYKTTADDVRRNLEALALVLTLGNRGDAGGSQSAPPKSCPEASGFQSASVPLNITRTSRPMFSFGAGPRRAG
jgi:hypothetical protein